MPEEKDKPPVEAPKETSAPVPPKSSDIVTDNHAKQIRELEGKLAKMEDGKASTKAELDELRAIVKKLGEVQAPVPVVKGASPVTLLQWIDDLVFVKKIE